jgi:outer membrane protein assembly factor BamA
MTRLAPTLVAALLAFGHVATAEQAAERATAQQAVVLQAGAGQTSAEQAVAPGEVLAEVRVHGNYATPDAEVLRLAGLTVGQPIDAATIDAAVRRLKESGQFDAVEIRKRYRSLEPGGDVALVIVVREHPLPDKTTPGPAPLRPFRRLFASGMVLPILSYTDGYGLTYGGRVSFVDVLGRGSRISVPASWGGTRRVAVEFDRPVFSGPFDRVTGGVGVSGRTNPFYEIDDNRQEAWVVASRQLATFLRAAGHAGFGRVHFGEITEDLVKYGADLTLDTRRDPVFPRNAVFTSVGWERLQPSQSAPVDRFHLDARAYRGLIGQSVLSLRVQYDGADGAQPAYARNLLGGAGSLRGYRAGSFAGDNLLAASAELRIPLTSPMGITRAGVSVFTDTGTVWDEGERLSDSRFRVGGGAGVFLLASLFQVSLDVGVRPGWGTRVHFTTGLQF